MHDPSLQAVRRAAAFESTVLENGLTVRVHTMPGFTGVHAVYGTKFGSIDRAFALDGKRVDLPAGIAHFLEHKMFENEEGDAFTLYARTGASANAYTSFDKTCYIFTASGNVAENLDILLGFVSRPYFTAATVEKEQGIIGQEIGMMDDTPGWQAMVGLYEGLYREHPVRVSIAGSVESIAEITPETLYTCHRAFYSPKNMALVVCGTADFDEVCRMAAQFSPQDAPEIGERHYGTRREAVNELLVTCKMQVSQPQFLIGFKDDPVQPGESRLRRSLLGELAVRILCGDTSPLYAQLYEKRLIGRDFDVDYSLIPEGACAMLGGESRNPEAVRATIEKETVRLAHEGVKPDLFDRMKKALYGLHLRVLDVPEAYARQEVTALFAGEHYPDFAALFDTIGPDDVQAMFARWARRDRCTMSVVQPK